MGPYIDHRLAMVGANGRPSFTDDAFEALYRHSGGVPRRLNTIAGRALLLGAVESRDVIDGAAIDATAADLAEDGYRSPEPVVSAAEPAPSAPANAERPRINFGERRAGIVAVPLPSNSDAALAERIAGLEARVEEQDAALRRVLTLLVNWVEGDAAQRRQRATPGATARPEPARRYDAQCALRRCRGLVSGRGLRARDRPGELGAAAGAGRAQQRCRARALR